MIDLAKSGMLLELLEQFRSRMIKHPKAITRWQQYHNQLGLLARLCQVIRKRQIAQVLKAGKL